VPPTDRYRPPSPNGPRQFGHQVLPVALCELDPTHVVHPRGLVDVIVDFDQAATVGVARFVVEKAESRTDAFGDRFQALVERGTGWE